MSVRLLLLVFLMLLRVLSASAEPDGAEIVRRSALRDDALRRDRQRYECDVEVRTEELDAQGGVTSSKTKHLTIRPSRDLSLAGEIPTKGRAAEEKETLDAKKFMVVMDMQKLAPRFVMSREGDDEILGRSCYVVRYRPRSGQSYDNREEKIMNQLTGRFWITKDDFSIVQSEGSLTQPVTVALVASVVRLDFKYQAQLLPSGEPAPATHHVLLGVKAPFYELRQRQTTTLKNYR